MALPKISIVTPSYNQARYLEQTILSVIEQKYPNLEYIVIDGGSTDDSVSIIKKYASKLSYWQTGPDNGQSDAINTGFSKSTGDILGWINSDDLLKPGTLQFIAEVFAERKKHQWLVGGTETIDESGRRKSLRFPSEIDLKTFIGWSRNWFPQQSTFWTRDLWLECGPLDPELHYAMDMDLWMKMFSICKPTTTKILLSCYRFHPQAKCVSQPSAAKQERNKVIRDSLLRSTVNRSEQINLEMWVDAMTAFADDANDYKYRIQRLKNHRVIGLFIALWARFVNPDLRNIF